MVEFADYECPYCQQIQPTLDKLEAEFKGKIRFAYKDMPLPMHPNAPKAAEAAHCAEAQGKYWEFHDLLAQNKQLALPALKENARTLKLDTAAFDKCLDSGEKAPIIKVHQSEAQALGVQGTPTFVINGRFINGTPDYDGLRKILEEEIGEATTVAQR
jgi:protein-disulfide isomerase